MVSSLGKNLFKRYEDRRVGRGGGEGHHAGLKGIKVALEYCYQGVSSYL